MYSRAIQACSPQEVRQSLTDSRIGSGRSPQNAQLTSIISNAGRLPNPARAPKPPAANTALSCSVRNFSQIRSAIVVVPCLAFVCGRVSAPSLVAQANEFGGRWERPVAVDADHGAGAAHAGLAPRP